MLNKIIILFITLNFNIAWAATLEGRVVGIADGDTITILDTTNTQHKIRLAGIDAPEKRQPFGNVSKQSLSDLVFGKQVVVDYQKLDRYDRVVGKVIVDGMNANLEQVKRGLAWYFKKYKSELVLDDRLAYLHAQKDAINARIGLWVEHNAIPPWEFRKANR